MNELFKKPSAILPEVFCLSLARLTLQNEVPAPFIQLYIIIDSRSCF